jgi:beta-lactamase regulating signal transducer with metallopeptidase domain
MPKVLSYILWAPVFFRLLCPFSFNSDLSFFNLVDLNAKQGRGVSEFIPQNTGAVQFGIDSAVNASSPTAVPSATLNVMQLCITVFSLVWIFGVVVLLFYSIFSCLKIKERLQTATIVRDNVFETDAVDTAFVFGFIRPRIYVPANIENAILPYILEHERVHILRRDYLIKPIAFLALILHWFNPLIWICFTLMSRDMDMSCDESVLYRLGEDAKGGYSNSLLALLIKRKGILTANSLAFGESHVKTRIKNVLKFKKPALWVIMVSIVAVLAAVIVFTANPSGEGTVSARAKRKLADVIDQYYQVADPINKGTLKIYNIKKYGSGYLVLAEKYSGDGDIHTFLFLINRDFSIVTKAFGNMPISPCFSANVVKHQGKSIVYGNFDKKRWDPNTDLVNDVQIDFIKIIFEDGTVVEEEVSMDKGYIVVADTVAGIKNIEVYNKQRELQSDLSETICHDQIWY